MTVEGNPSCQHGPAECATNTLMSCAIHALPRFQPHGPPPAVPLAQCIFAAQLQHRVAPGDMRALAHRCLADAGLDVAAVQACADGPLGQHLQVRVAPWSGLFLSRWSCTCAALQLWWLSTADARLCSNTAHAAPALGVTERHVVTDCSNQSITRYYVHQWPYVCRFLADFRQSTQRWSNA